MEIFVTWVYALTYLAVFGYLAYLFWRYRRAK
jgi:heme/copper-type cytochrome/quinol oxidase subunit 2